MQTNVYYATDGRKPIVNTSREEWYYSGSFLDGEKSRILVFSVKAFFRPPNSPARTYEGSRTVYINLGQFREFPIKLKLAGKDITIVESAVDVHVRANWLGLEVTATD